MHDARPLIPPHFWYGLPPALQRAVLDALPPGPHPTERLLPALLDGLAHEPPVQQSVLALLDCWQKLHALNELAAAVLSDDAHGTPTDGRRVAACIVAVLTDRDPDEVLGMLDE